MSLCVIQTQNKEAVHLLSACNLNIHRQKTLKKQQKCWDAWEVAGQASPQDLPMLREGGGRGGCRGGRHTQSLPDTAEPLNGYTDGVRWQSHGFREKILAVMFWLHVNSTRWHLSLLEQKLWHRLRHGIVMLGASRQNSQDMFRCIPGSLCQLRGAESRVINNDNVLSLGLASQL